MKHLLFDFMVNGLLKSLVQSCNLTVRCNYDFTTALQFGLDFSRHRFYNDVLHYVCNSSCSLVVLSLTNILNFLALIFHVFASYISYIDIVVFCKCYCIIH